MPILRYLLTFVFLVFIVFVVYQKAISFLSASNYFTIRGIMYPPALKFLATSEINNLKGKSLLTVDLEKMQKQMQARYPQFAQMRILKRFPDQIVVIAKERLALAAVKLRGQNFIIDKEGVIMSKEEGNADSLPLIVGASAGSSRLTAGSTLRGSDVQTAMRIIQTFHSSKALSGYPIIKLDVTRFPQTSFYLTEDLKVIVNQEDMNYKLRILSLLLSQAKKELGDVKYIDLRFKEPILGKK